MEIRWTFSESNEFSKSGVSGRKKAMVAATSILKKVRMNGDKAVIDAARKFDHSNITIDTIKISEDEIVDAKKQVDQSFKIAANETYKRVKIFSELSLKDDWKRKQMVEGL